MSAQETMTNDPGSMWAKVGQPLCQLEMWLLWKKSRVRVHRWHIMAFGRLDRLVQCISNPMFIGENGGRRNVT